MGDLRGQRRLEEGALQLCEQGYCGHNQNVITVLRLGRTAYQNQAGQKARTGQQYLIDYASGKNANEAIVGADLGNSHSYGGKLHQWNSANSTERLLGFPKRHVWSARPRASEVATPVGLQARHRPVLAACRMKTNRPAASVGYQRPLQLLLRGTVTQAGFPRRKCAPDLHCVHLVTREFCPASLATVAAAKARPTAPNPAGQL